MVKKTICEEIKSIGEKERLYIKKWIRISVGTPALLFVFSVLINYIMEGKLSALFVLLNLLMLNANIFISALALANDIKENDVEIKEDTRWYSLIGFFMCWIMYSFFSGFFTNNEDNSVAMRILIGLSVIAVLLCYCVVRKAVEIREYMFDGDSVNE